MTVAAESRPNSGISVATLVGERLLSVQELPVIFIDRRQRSFSQPDEGGLV
jgi:hypothetical protein